MRDINMHVLLIADDLVTIADTQEDVRASFAGKRGLNMNVKCQM